MVLDIVIIGMVIVTECFRVANMKVVESLQCLKHGPCLFHMQIGVLYNLSPPFYKRFPGERVVPHPRVYTGSC